MSHTMLETPISKPIEPIEFIPVGYSVIGGKPAAGLGRINLRALVPGDWKGWDRGLTWRPR